jgi:hypothetical protein
VAQTYSRPRNFGDPPRVRGIEEFVAYDRQSGSSIPLCQSGKNESPITVALQLLSSNGRSGAVPLARNPAPRADGCGAMVLLNNTGHDWVILAASTSQSCARIGKRRRMACVVEMLTPQFHHISTEKAILIPHTKNTAFYYQFPSSEKHVSNCKLE